MNKCEKGEIEFWQLAPGWTEGGGGNGSAAAGTGPANEGIRNAAGAAPNPTG